MEDKLKTKAGRASHVIPARLLSQFGTPPCLLSGERRHWQLCRYCIDQEPKKIAISQVFERDFYSFQQKDGSRDDSHEARMANDIEGPFNKLLPYFDLSIYVPNRNDGVIISRYIANLFNRTHQRRRASLLQQAETATVSRLLVEDRSKLLQLVAAYSLLIERPMNVDDVARGTSTLYRDDENARNSFFLSNLARHEATLFNLLQGRPYGLLRAPKGSEFVLSDTAVITRVPIGNGAYSIGEGFDKRHVYTLLPISPFTCLQVGIDRLTDTTLSAHDVNLINIDSIKLMHRWVYGRSYNPQIAEAIQSCGSTVKYKVHAFRTRELTVDSMLNLLVQGVLDEIYFGRPTYKSLNAGGRNAEFPRRSLAAGSR